ncbi:hypothetical protein [Paenibacillus sp. DMB5]|uniref:hypothetical protein n=1 Tax=Paenibacillus sp. DMB5 TaxID=1780103 RepID=UPI00076C2FB3|nr:hypothetical protein [Paenibacillus sp. DMB5]KUP20515.1 hypothetical protein AWJ19_28050 [Paenibacillus sp. DMB5]
MKKWIPLLVICLLAIGIMSYSKLKVSEVAASGWSVRIYVVTGRYPPDFLQKRPLQHHRKSSYS